MRGPSHSAILTWHSLDDSGSVISTPPSVFRRQIESLAESGIPVVPLDQAPRSPGTVALTFDDGCLNLAEHAFPLLEQFHLPATVFVVSRFCGRSNQWPTQPSGTVPCLPLLSWEQLSAVPAVIEVGAHTATHPRLNQLAADVCEGELRECRDEIEQRLSRPVRTLAYPYGDSSDSVRLAAGRYFDLAVGTSLRFVSPASDPLNLPRLDMYYFRGGFSAERLFHARTRWYVGSRHAIREIRSRMRA